MILTFLASKHQKRQATFAHARDTAIETNFKLRPVYYNL